MERVVRELLTGGYVERDMELSLSQAESDSFAAFVKNDKYDDFFSDVKGFLPGSPARFISQDSAAVDQDETISRPLPCFGDLQLDFRVNPSLGVALAALAQNGPMNDHLGFLRELLNREWLQVRCAKIASAKSEQAK